MSDDKTIGMELSQEEFLARVRTARMGDEELARRYGKDGRPAPDALPVEDIYQRLVHSRHAAARGHGASSPRAPLRRPLR